LITNDTKAQVFEVKSKREKKNKEKKRKLKKREKKNKEKKRKLKKREKRQEKKKEKRDVRFSNVGYTAPYAAATWTRRKL
jgi:hypothetical protein